MISRTGLETGIGSHHFHQKHSDRSAATACSLPRLPSLALCILAEALNMQRYWRGGTRWCCKSSHCALALAELGSSWEAMGLSERWIYV